MPGRSSAPRIHSFYLGTSLFSHKAHYFPTKVDNPVKVPEVIPEKLFGDLPPSCICFKTFRRKTENNKNIYFHKPVQEKLMKLSNL
jgi:hypothetical protein